RPARQRHSAQTAPLVPNGLCLVTKGRNSKSEPASRGLDDVPPLEAIPADETNGKFGSVRVDWELPISSGTAALTNNMKMLDALFKETEKAPARQSNPMLRALFDGAMRTRSQRALFDGAMRTRSQRADALHRCQLAASEQLLGFGANSGGGAANPRRLRIIPGLQLRSTKPILSLWITWSPAVEFLIGWIDSILASMDPNRSSWISLLQHQQQHQQLSLKRQSDLSISASRDDASPLSEFANLNPRNSCLESEFNSRASEAARASVAAALIDFLVSLEDWATLNRLEETVPVLLNYGFDCASFINDVITEEDLQEMGILCPGQRRHILVAVLDLPKGIQTASLSASATVETFLQRLCLQQHLAAERRILRCLSRLSLRSSPNLLLCQQQQQQQQHSNRVPYNSCNSSHSLDRTIDSKYPASRIRQSLPQEANKQPNQTLQIHRKRQKRKKESSMEQLDHQTSAFKPEVKPGWPHHPQVLLGGRVAYAVSYLGFCPVKDHTDRGEVECHMRHFRCKSADILKLPQISLSISCLGVKFVNPDNENIQPSQMVITEHRITDIYFVSQDSSLRSNFAYIVRDSSSGTHYCHCFASHSGEACSLADQLIEFNSRRTDQRRQQSDA
uniref:PID domain-containing protein n=1 Tax=Macrostomum lignano TaxID=282301 RepID=A0A1I8J8E3_9PLAT